MVGDAPGLAVREADRLVQGDLAAPRDDDDRAVVALLLDVALDTVLQSAESLGVETGGGVLDGHAVAPPSTGIATPVTNEAASEQSQTTAAAISSGSA